MHQCGRITVGRLGEFENLLRDSFFSSKRTLGTSSFNTVFSKSDYRGFVICYQKSEFINNMVILKRTPYFICFVSIG